ncbi:MAG: hypothetical protein MJ252_10990 [archaeon]|nr:hypothetical protein [archaeon]
MQAEENPQPKKKIKNPLKKKIKNELTEEQKAEVREAYEYFKESGLPPEELGKVMNAMGLDTSKPEIQRMMEALKNQGDKPISFDDYCNILFEKPSEDPVEEMRKLFELMKDKDESKGDVITFESLKEFCQSIGETLKDNELTEMIEEAADFNKDGDEINFETFLTIMRKSQVI